MKFVIRIEKNKEFLKRVTISFKTYQSLNKELDKIIKSNGWDKKEISFVLENFGKTLPKEVLDGWLNHKN